MIPDLTTERLWLRPLRTQDAEDLHELLSDPEAMRYWHRDPTASLDETRLVVAEMLRVDPATWVFGRHGSVTVLGNTGGIGPFELGGHAGFGYGLRRSEWGQGLAAEASRAALDYAFTTVGIARAELWIDRENRQSVRVAEKLGCQRRAEVCFAYARGRTPSFVYGVTAEAWRGEAEPPRMHYLAEPILSVSDVSAAIQWWRAKLGFEAGFIVGDPPTKARVLPAPRWTGLAGVQLSLRPRSEVGGSTVMVSVTDVDALAERAIANGAAVVTPLVDHPWGLREIELADDDGNRIRLSAPAP